MTESEERDRVIEVATSWLRTPYHDLAKLKFHGVDCAMLIVAVFEEAGIESPIPVEHYSPQWYLHRSDEKFMETVLTRAREIPEAEARPADVVLYKFGRCFAHGGIVMPPGFPRIIHAYKQAGFVVLGEGASGDLGFEGSKAQTPKPRERRFFTRHAWGT